MATYQEIKDLLESKLAVDQAEHNTILQKIAEIKEDTIDIKTHAKETNGNVARNLERIHSLEVEQNLDNKFRKSIRWIGGSLTILLLANMILKFIL